MVINKWAGRCLVAALIGAGLVGCGGSDSPAPVAAPAPTTPGPAPAPAPGAAVTFNATALMANEADNIIAATYSDLDARAGALLAAVQALEATKTQPVLEAAQVAWRATRVPWESSEGFLFGPVESLGIDPAIDSWPLNTADLEAFLATNPAATQAQIETAGDDVRGFHAIEFLLFGDGVATNQKAVADLTAPQLNYLVALTQALKARTNVLATSWTVDFNGAGPYAALLRSPNATNTLYQTPGAVIQELVNGLITIASEVGTAKMSEPLGTSAATANTSLVESQYSWNSLTDFHNNIQSILNVYTGKRGFSPATDTLAATDNGLFAFVNAHDPALARLVHEQILDAMQKIALVKADGNPNTTEITGTAQPFRNQIRTAPGRALIATAIASLGTLQTTLETRVLPLVASTTFAN